MVNLKVSPVIKKFFANGKIILTFCFFFYLQKLFILTVALFATISNADIGLKLRQQQLQLNSVAPDYLPPPTNVYLPAVKNTYLPPVPCPANSVGTSPPNCQCVAGYEKQGQQCVPKPCPQYTTGWWPNCQPIACPAPKVGSLPYCACPAGLTEQNGDCIRPYCPSGQVGTWPNCRCPDYHQLVGKVQLKFVSH